ncbi:MAG: 23S rRNA (guanosine(2251)-2'-O)-methyltransferase RlmB [Coriobacteriales bacterium]|jgi:23S rRNA (guanosine2251-2'-O)-methyltransferase|nr:23S rRNA (guanosine(2251)-2'-O)-methyltransferase RlmB [Coriobacteriales bacterium]
MREWREQSLEFGDAPYVYEYASLYDLIELARGKKDALIIALDHITDVGNLGAIIRSAEVVGATGVIIPKKRAAQVNNTVYRTSAGAVEYLKVAQEANISASLKRLKDEGFWVGAASAEAPTSLWNAPIEGRLVVVMGAEDSGISRLVRETCDFEFKLPQRGFTQSLNVAQACTAIAYEWLRRAQ